MTQQELLERCVLSVLSAEHLSQCNTFDCGSSEDEQDLNDFFANDAIPYQQKLLGKTYLFRSRQNPKEIVTAFTLANDSIRLTNKLAEEYKDSFLEDTDLCDKSIKRFPAVLLGRLGTSTKFAHQGYGSAVMDFIKNLFRESNKTGCRFIIVDALNNADTLRYYERNGFRYLVEDERLEAKYVGIGIGRLPLHTRLMYFDLLNMEIVEE